MSVEHPLREEITAEADAALHQRELQIDLDALDAAVLRLASDHSVLRLSETEAEAQSGYVPPTDEGAGERMLMNMGPQHPSTHGVLRLVLELDGETIKRSKPVIGYLHTGMEKTGEDLTYVQGATNVTRMDYASPLFNELAFSLTTEALLGIEVPERAQWIRMLMCELNRLSSHMLFMATNGMDLGAVSMMLYGWREREEILRFLEMVTGLRMNHNYIRPGGVAADLPDGWRDSLLAVLEPLPDRIVEFDTLMTNQPIWRERLQGVGRDHRRGGPGPRRDGADPAVHRLRLGPASRHALPALRGRRLRRVRGELRRQLRPLRHPPGRDRRVDSHRPPDPRQDAAR